LKILLISTYELGRQPFGLASPAAWLRNAGMSVACHDLSREQLREDEVREADLIAFYVPMHTATRLAIEALPVIRRSNPSAHLCFYGLYAPVNEDYLRRLGAQTILGGEFEEGLLRTAQQLRARRFCSASSQFEIENPGTGRNATTFSQSEPVISHVRLRFQVPNRTGMPPLARYAHLEHPDGEPRVVGYTEASRGCKHLCRHCPVVPVYHGRFRIIQPEIVLADIRQQVEVGAQHITFGDPDFFNGIRHALRIVTALHQEFPALTYDVTIKVEHLLKHAEYLQILRDTGCLFVTTAVESLDDRTLALLEKGHTRADFLRVVELFQQTGLTLSPTFVAFTPWTTLGTYCELLEAIAELDLVEQVAPIQLGIRLLIPAGSRLLELAEVRKLVGAFDEVGLVYPWRHQDPRVDELYEQVQSVIQIGLKNRESRRAIFFQVREVAFEMAGYFATPLPELPLLVSRASIPYLTEPWYC
jgi:radical SAM superfamily enzyme YgiQ (UPF0313 family)